MTIRTLNTLLILLGALTVTSCATTDSELREDALSAELERLELEIGETTRSVPEFRVDGWRSIDDRNLILTAGRHDHYLVKLRGICPELRHAFSIGLKSQTMSLTRLDSIVVRSLHNTLDTCMIDEIFRLRHTEPVDG